MVSANIDCTKPLHSDKYQPSRCAKRFQADKIAYETCTGALPFTMKTLQAHKGIDTPLLIHNRKRAVVRGFTYYLAIAARHEPLPRSPVRTIGVSCPACAGHVPDIRQRPRG